METKVNVSFTLQGLASVQVVADTEQEQEFGTELLKQIRPCLDVADAILKKTNAGPRG